MFRRLKTAKRRQIGSQKAHYFGKMLVSNSNAVAAYLL